MKAPDLTANEHVLLVVEGHAACASWPAHLGLAPEGGWCMLEQEEWECLEAFRARLADALERIGRSGALGPVVLVASRFWDPGALIERRKLTVEILSRLAQAGGGDLVLTHGHQHDPPSRDALSMLSTELSPEWADSTVSVTARFDDRTRRGEPRRASSPVLRATGQATAT